MHCFTHLLTNLLLLYTVLCKNAGHRDPRFIRGTYTATVFETSTVTSVVPSPCVQVDPTLPPCRSVRFLFFPKTENTNEITTNDGESKSDPILTTPLGWGEYLGIYAPTVTLVKTQLVTTMVTDPGIAVTYSVKGCKPLHLPENMERCPVQDSVIINTVLPTSTIAPSATIPVSTPVNSKVINVTEGTSIPVSDINENLINNKLEASKEARGAKDDIKADAISNKLESSVAESENSDRQPRATDPLPF